MAQSPYDTYKQNRQDVEESVKKDYDALKNSAGQAVSDYSDSVTAAYDTAKQQAADSAAAQRGTLPQQYRATFDKNELQQRINERQLKERMNQLGLTDSGLNRTQQAAVNLQRSNADLAAAQQKTAAANAINQQLAENQAALEQQKQLAIANAQYNVQSRLPEYLYALMNSAADRNASMANAYYNGELDRYATDKSYDASKYNADKDYAASVYGTDKSYDASRYNADRDYDASRYSTDVSNSLSRYEIDRNNALKLLDIVAGMADGYTPADKNYVLQVLDELRRQGY
ncbi:MAG TPA: hypothetical protein H9668_06320 [Firmicutes bacterium]|nr:hypothetical protein [Bacillota bacterium]